jgi:hypothetical protein
MMITVLKDSFTIYRFEMKNIIILNRKLFNKLIINYSSHYRLYFKSEQLYRN